MGNLSRGIEAVMLDIGEYFEVMAKWNGTSRADEVLAVDPEPEGEDNPWLSVQPPMHMTSEQPLNVNGPVEESRSGVFESPSSSGDGRGG